MLPDEQARWKCGSSRVDISSLAILDVPELEVPFRKITLPVNGSPGPSVSGNNSCKAANDMPHILADQQRQARS